MMRYCLWYLMTISTPTFLHMPYGSLLQENCSKKNNCLKWMTRYHNYAARCFSLVSTCCPVSLYLHSYMVDFMTSVCMIACLSTVRSNYQIYINAYINVDQCLWRSLALHCSCKYMLSFITVLILTGSCSCTITLQLIFPCPPFSMHYQIYICSYQYIEWNQCYWRSLALHCSCQYLLSVLLYLHLLIVDYVASLCILA